MSAPRFVVTGLVGVVLANCAQDGLGKREELASLDENYFRCNVQPILAARCAFMACHGNDDRPLMLFAEQRFRLGIPWDEYETPLTEEELLANFRMTSGFVGRDGDETNLLADKPLDSRAGGLFHRGRDLFGEDDVFLERRDIGYQVLRDFAAGAFASEDCVVREEVGQ